MPDVFDYLFGGWQELSRILIVGLLSYGAIVLLLRGAGKRALAKMSAYDLIVTVALGSALATAILSPGMTLDRALLAFVLLLGLQRLLAWLSMKSQAFYKLTNNDPALVAYGGRYIDAAMRRENLTPQDVEAAIRASGRANVSNVEAVVLETDGTLSVIARLDGELPGPLGRTQKNARANQP